MTTNMGIKRVVVDIMPSSCGWCEFGYDNGWLDNPPKDTCILMDEPLEIWNHEIKPDWCPLALDIGQD